MKTYEKIFLIGAVIVSVTIITGVTLFDIFWYKSNIWDALKQALGLSMFHGFGLLGFYLVILLNKSKRKS